MKESIHDSFPSLSNQQCAVLMADGATGHVLTVTGNIAIDSKSNIYKVFDNVEEARKFIQNKQLENETLEYVIYNNKKDPIEYIKAPKWK